MNGVRSEALGSGPGSRAGWTRDAASLPAFG